MSGVNGTLLELWEALIDDDASSFSSDSQQESTVGSLNTWFSSGMSVLSPQKEAVETKPSSAGKKWFKMPTRPRANTRILITETEDASQLESRGMEANAERARAIVAPMQDDTRVPEETLEETTVDERIVESTKKYLPIPVKKSRSLDHNIRDVSVGGEHDESIIGRSIPAVPVTNETELKSPEKKKRSSLRKAKSLSKGKLKTIDEDSTLPSEDSFVIKRKPRGEASQKKSNATRTPAQSQHTKRIGKSKKTEKTSSRNRRSNNLLGARQQSHVPSRQPETITRRPRELTHLPGDAAYQQRMKPRTSIRKKSLDSYERRQAPQSKRYSEPVSRSRYPAAGIDQVRPRSSSRVRAKESPRDSSHQYRSTLYTPVRPSPSPRGMTKATSTRMHGDIERSTIPRQYPSYRSDPRKSYSVREAPIRRERFSDEWRSPSAYSSRRMRGWRDDSDAYTYYY